MHNKSQRCTTSLLSSPAATTSISTLIHNIKLSIDHQSSHLLLRLHAVAFPRRLHLHPLISSRLISAYSILFSTYTASSVFEATLREGSQSPLPWNAMLATLSRDGLFHDAMYLYSRMLFHTPPDGHTLSITAKIAGEITDLIAGRIVHSSAVRLGFASDVVLLNTLTAMYFRCGDQVNARKMFEQMPVRSVSSWNILISESGEAHVTDLLAKMQKAELKPDKFTISTVLRLCAADSSGKLLPRGREIHGFALRNGLGLGSELDPYIDCCLIDVYCKSGSTKKGRIIFNEIICKNVVAWTAIISGYVQNENPEEALVLFFAMTRRSRVLPNKATLVSILPAIGALSRLISGKEAHGFSIRAELTFESSLNNALIDMYSKCGCLDYSKRVFEQDFWEKDSISWSVIISSLGLHGRGEDAISVFEKMIELGVRQDEITCLGILSACGRCGLVAEGVEIYNSMIEDHGVLPTAEIASCVVDMFCRAGETRLALDFIKATPLASTAGSWGTLLGVSVAEKNMELGDLARERLLRLEPENPSNLVAISNLLASREEWEEAAELRKKMRERALTKKTGRSWIPVNAFLPPPVFKRICPRWPSLC